MASQNTPFICTPQAGHPRLRKTPSAAHSLLPHSQPSTQHPPDGPQSSGYEAPNGDSLSRRFPVRLFELLESETMNAFIYWYQDGESRGLFIPSIKAFVTNVLPNCFPEMKQWGSFQKQLNNYGFEKRDRSKIQGRYAHWDNRFWRGRRDLLPRVVRRPKPLHFQDAVQERPITPDTPPAASVIPQPPNQPDPYARIYYLEKKLETVDSELKATQARLGTMEAMVRQLSNQLRALSIGNSSPKLQVPTEPAGGTPGTQYSIHGASYSSRIQTGIAPRSLIGAQDGGHSQRIPSQPGPGMSYDSINLIIAHEPPPVYPQWPANASSAGPSRSLHHASGQPTAGVPFIQESWMQHGSVDNVGPMFFNQGFGQQPYAGASAGPQTFTPTTFTTAPTNPAQFRPQCSNSPGASSGRRQFGGTAPVPLPQARQGR